MNTLLDTREVTSLVRAVRPFVDMNQQDLANQVGVSRGQVSNWERNSLSKPSKRHDTAIRDAAKEILTELLERI